MKSLSVPNFRFGDEIIAFGQYYPVATQTTEMKSVKICDTWEYEPVERIYVFFTETSHLFTAQVLEVKFFPFDIAETTVWRHGQLLYMGEKSLLKQYLELKQHSSTDYLLAEMDDIWDKLMPEEQEYVKTFLV